MRTSNNADKHVSKKENPMTKGTRTSARQREKLNKLLLMEREKELARQQAGKPDKQFAIFSPRGRISIIAVLVL